MEREMTEKHIYYSDDKGIRVTDKELTIGKTTYSLKTIASVKYERKASEYTKRVF
jgi:hypothetical protein